MLIFGVGFLLKKYKVEIIEGEVFFVDDYILCVIYLDLV